MRKQYAYAEKQKEEICEQLKKEKIWLNVIASRNNLALEDSKLREIDYLQKYFEFLRKESKYLIILSGRDEKSKKERNIDYEFAVGHPNYSVEYLDNKLKVCCVPLRYCRIKIKSQGYVELYITKINGMPFTSTEQYTQHITADIAHTLGIREMGIYRYNTEGESAESRGRRF